VDNPNGGISDPTQPPNATIAGMVATEFCQQKSLNGVAQAVIDCIARNHQEAFMEGKLKAPTGYQKREDMTLLVCNFHHPLPLAGRGYVSSISGGHLDMIPGNNHLMIDVHLDTTGSETLRNSQTMTSSIYSSTGEDDESSPVALPLDQDGKIAPYISFQQYNEHPDRARIEAEIQQLLDSISNRSTIREEAEPTENEEVVRV
jgi:hypothetical protein